MKGFYTANFQETISVFLPFVEQVLCWYSQMYKPRLFIIEWINNLYFKKVKALTLFFKAYK